MRRVVRAFSAMKPIILNVDRKDPGLNPSAPSLLLNHLGTVFTFPKKKFPRSSFRRQVATLKL